MENNMKYAIAVMLVLTLSGCGYFEQFVGGVTGGVYETCVDGVAYLQFNSGVSVKYLPDSKVVTCERGDF